MYIVEMIGYLHVSKGGLDVGDLLSLVNWVG